MYDKIITILCHISISGPINQYYTGMCGSRGGDQGIRTPHPLKNHKNLDFLSNTCPDSLKNYKATEPEFNVGPSAAHKQNTI